MAATKRNIPQEDERIEEGRLNDLPESLLSHIVSFLDTKAAVQISMISKQWFNLCTSMPVLHLNSFDFHYVDDFDKYVNHVLRYRDESAELNTLTFTRRGVSSAKIIKSVLDYALSHGVNHLELFIKRLKNDSLPAFLHTKSDSLKTLKLTTQSYVSCPFLSGSFKNLTVLYLKGVIIKNREPLAGFPMLEKLVLKDCYLGKILSLQALKLSDLTISCHGCFDRCELTTPNLRFFKYRGSEFPVLVTHDGVPVLERVVIDFHGFCYIMEEMRVIDDLISLLWAVGNAKSVTISSAIVDLICLFGGKFEKLNSPFWKLKCLNVDARYPEEHKSLFQRVGRRQTIEMREDVKAYLLKGSPGADFNIITH